VAEPEPAFHLDYRVSGKTRGRTRRLQQKPFPNQLRNLRPRSSLIILTFSRAFRRAGEAAAIFENNHARTVIKRACSNYGGEAVWNLILSAPDAGFLAAPTNIHLRGPSLHMIFPNGEKTFCRRFDLTKSQRPKKGRQADHAGRPHQAASERLEPIVSAH
jgi:hypothetical protein